MEVGCGWGADLPCARRHWRRFRSTSRRGSSTASWRVRWWSSNRELHARWRYRVDVAIAVAVTSVRLLHVDGLRPWNSTRCCCGALREKILQLLHHRRAFAKLTLGGDCSREILRDDGTGFGSEIGSVLGRGGLELDGCCLLYLKTKEKFCIVTITKVLLKGFNSLSVVSLSIDDGQVVGH